ncbi:MAG TPA: LytTR family DNA-binding domain-containing protein [Puia sp.]|nr:LytTR family DNA-binding domain-containing protein [Puia sp.]
MWKLLRQPFPRYTRVAQRARTALGFGLFVFLFLLIFRPFGLEHMQTLFLVKTTFWYGVVCFGVLLGWFLGVPRLCSPIFREDAWTVWKEILHMLTCVLAVCVGNILFTHFYFHEAFSGRLVLRFLWWTFIVSILPITLMVLFRQISLMRTFSRQAADLDKQLTEARAAALARSSTSGGSDPDGSSPYFHPELPPASHRLGSDGPSPSFDPEPAPPSGNPGPARSSPPSGNPGPDSSLSALHSAQFLYAEAADNYVKIFYTDDQQLIRSTLRQLEEIFQGNERIFRCHRTYLVNLDKVVHISGNAQGYKLHLEGVSQIIPVSRSLNGQIASLVARPKDLPKRPGDL